MSHVVVETSRLTLRHLNETDGDFIFRLLNEPSFLEFVGDKGVRTIEDAKTYISDGPMASYSEHGFGLYLVERSADGAPIGMCGLLKRDTLDDVDIGFALLPEFWSQGYAVEASQAVLGSARTAHGLDRVVAITAQHNAASKRVLERIGMHFDKLIQSAAETDEICLFSVDL